MIKLENIDQMLKNHRLRQDISEPEDLKFKFSKNKDVYNPSTEFCFKGKKIIAVRTEERNSEKSKTCFLEKNDGNFYKFKENVNLPLQDPFIFKIANENYLGGVKVNFQNKLGPVWWTEVFQIEEDFTFKRIFKGPKGMKDIRLLQLKDGNLVVFTRPQNPATGDGKIGILVISDFDQLDAKSILNAELLKNNFANGTWGGVNQAIEVTPDVIFIIGHIACYKNNVRHYYVLAAYIDLKQKVIFGEKIIAERKDFLEGPAKRNDLKDIVFPSGIFKNGKNNIILMAGVSDCEIQIAKFNYNCDFL